MPQVKIGPEFFAKARNDYSDWTWALVREFFQNSIDCGSKTVSLRVGEQDGRTVLVVENDGKPMTEDILVNKLLSLGSSGKDFANGSVGGFGKAKELLYFCWTGYTIESGEHVVTGSGAEYKLEKASKSFKGTRSTIVIPGNHAAALTAKAEFFIAAANVSCRFILNGVEAETKLRKGAYRRDLRCGKVYTNRQMSGLVVVRIGGIPMFVTGTKFQGCVVLELNGVSSDVLTSNRDGLRYEHRQELEAFIGDLTTNKRKALREPRTEYFRFDGNKIVCAGMRKQAAAHGNEALAADPVEEGPTISAAALASGEGYGVEEIIEHDTARAHALANAFIVKNETRRNVPAAYRPDNEDFCKYAYKLANIWARLLTVMHRIFEHNDEFTIGFIFSEECLAQYENSPQYGKVYYINPVKIENGTWTKRYNYSPYDGREDLNQIAISALHELVHGMGYGDHDEDYAAKLTDMAGKLLGHTKDLLWCYREGRN